MHLSGGSGSLARVSMSYMTIPICHYTGMSLRRGYINSGAVREMLEAALVSQEQHLGSGPRRNAGPSVDQGMATGRRTQWIGVKDSPSGGNRA
jgi:hypothetical protein